MKYIKSIFVGFISALVATLCVYWIIDLRNNGELISKLVRLKHLSEFDYIIVGAGTSGCVLAHSLVTKSNNSVLLIEAGHRFGFVSDIPLLAPFLQRSPYDWSFVSQAQSYSSYGLINRRQFLPRGKGLGGSSQINFMLNFPGNEKDFIRWQNITGITYWSYETLKPYFDTLENAKGDIWEIPSKYSKLVQSFQEASIEFKNLKFRRSQYNIKNGVRWGVYQKYLRSAFNQPNLHILINTFVHKVNINKMSARSVTVSSVEDESSKITILARKEIIISAGAYQSPQLLMNSGIGPKSILDSANVQIVAVSNNVGKNLHDHFNLPLFISINDTASINLNKLLNITEIRNYIVHGTGHFANFGVLGHIDGLTDPFGITLFGVGAIDENSLMTISNFHTHNFRELFPLYFNTSQEGFLFISNCYQPQSRGTVRITNSTTKPLIDPQYLSHPSDIECTIKAIRMAAKIATSDAFKSLGPKIHWPQIKDCLPDSRASNDPSDSYLECILRNVGLTSHHPGGTCSMGSNISNSVVDGELKVHGIKNLRIVDGSIFPTPISGNPNAVLVAVAKRTADMILL